MKKGRIIEVHRTNFTVAVDEQAVSATVRGDFHLSGSFPVVGDYVELTILDDGKAVIEKLEERKSVIKRRGAENDEVQVLVANVDLIIIVMGLDGDYNLSRLERYLLLAVQSEIPAIVVLNKRDVVDDVASVVEEAQMIAGEVPVYAVSALLGDGLTAVAEHLHTGTTAVLLGSSGAGKSTITNWLLQENRQEVRQVRTDDSHGRHTTTSRQLFTLPQGSFLIDTPGMRELGVLEADTSDELAVFSKIEALATLCKFRNCDHENSAGCAVLAAVESGELSEREFHNYQKLLRERAFQESKDSTAASRHYAQVEKRRNQRNEVIRRQRLSRR
jgi:ribosome biogenesis GTPase / thiamine phosphate phosphatase